MPIRPENRKRYPPNWARISLAIKERAQWRCECRGECGRPHTQGRCMATQGSVSLNLLGRVVLTTAHLDHTPENCSPENLRAMCNACHLRYDAKHHAQTAYNTRRSGKAAGDLFT